MLAHGLGASRLERLSHAQAQELAPREGDVRQQGLAHQVMRKREAHFRSLGTGHNKAHLLGLLECDQEFVKIGLALQRVEEPERHGAQKRHRQPRIAAAEHRNDDSAFIWN